jgi:hypothetical protein
MGKTIEKILFSSGLVVAAGGILAESYGLCKGLDAVPHIIGGSIAGGLGTFLMIGSIGLRKYREFCEEEDTQDRYRNISQDIQYSNRDLN